MTMPPNLVRVRGRVRVRVGARVRVFGHAAQPGRCAKQHEADRRYA